jgi:hypothetical protein
VALRLRTEHALVDLQHALLCRARGHGHEVERRAAVRAACRQQRPFRAHELIDVVEDGGRLEQPLAIGQHQRGYAAQRIEFPDAFEVLAHRPVAVFERYL